MAEWDDVLKYEADIKEIANKLCMRVDPSLCEDVIQHTYISLVEKLDMSAAKGPEREYVRGAIWKTVQKFLNAERAQWRHVSLDNLLAKDLQVDQDGNARWPGPHKIFIYRREESDE